MSIKILKYIGTGVGALAVGVMLMFGATKVVYPAISSLVGLAVAQTATLWNNVKDASVGDNITNGILASSIYLFDGTNFDRVRGTGGSMNVSLVGAITPADGYANPTTASQVWSLGGVFNGTTWDRWRGQVSPVQGATLLNNSVGSAANTALTQVVSGVAGTRIHLYKITRILCTPAGAANFSVTDGVTIIYSTPNASVPTTPQQFNEEWAGTGLTMTTGASMTLTVSACGSGNSSNLQYEADQF